MLTTNTIKRYTPSIVKAVGDKGYDTSKGVVVKAVSHMHVTVHYQGQQIGMGQLQHGGMALIIAEAK